MMFLQGDKVEIVVINASGIRQELMELRKDWSLLGDGRGRLFIELLSQLWCFLCYLYQIRPCLAYRFFLDHCELYACWLNTLEFDCWEWNYIQTVLGFALHLSITVAICIPADKHIYIKSGRRIAVFFSSFFAIISQYFYEVWNTK